MAEEFEINLDETIVEPAFSEFDDVLPFDNTPQKEGLGRKQIIILVSIGAAVLLGLIGLIIGLLLFSGRSTDDGLILENVFAAGVDLSGMTVEEAVNALHVATDDSICKEPMVIHIYDGTLSLYPDETNAILDVDAIAQAAYNYGRSGTHAENQQIQKKVTCIR